MESYTTISVKPDLKKVLKKLKQDGETYGDYIQNQIPEDTLEEALEQLDADGELTN